MSVLRLKEPALVCANIFRSSQTLAQGSLEIIPQLRPAQTYDNLFAPDFQVLELSYMPIFEGNYF